MSLWTSSPFDHFPLTFPLCNEIYFIFLLVRCKFCTGCTSLQASLCNAAPCAECKRRWKGRFLGRGWSCGCSVSVCACPHGGTTKEGYLLLSTSCLILGKSLSLLQCCLPSPSNMAYPVLLLLRAVCSYSGALENTSQPGRYCVNANYSVAVLKMLFRP